jgi:hypothetical protein
VGRERLAAPQKACNESNGAALEHPLAALIASAAFLLLSGVDRHPSGTHPMCGISQCEYCHILALRAKSVGVQSGPAQASVG